MTSPGWNPLRRRHKLNGAKLDHLTSPRNPRVKLNGPVVSGGCPARLLPMGAACSLYPKEHINDSNELI